MLAQHLLDQQQRIGSDVERPMTVGPRPLERRQQAAILGDVIGRDADRFAELLDQRAVFVLDADAKSGGSGIPRAPPSIYATIIERRGWRRTRLEPPLPPAAARNTGCAGSDRTA